MAPPLPKQLRVMCPENKAFSRFFLEKWQSMAREPEGLTENQRHAFANAKRSISVAEDPMYGAQEEMLQKKLKMVNAGASRNIFKLVWSDKRSEDLV